VRFAAWGLGMSSKPITDGEHYTTAAVFRRMDEVLFDWPMNIREVGRAALKLLKREKRISGGFKDAGDWCVPVLT
jgi:hypothetical protein